MAGTISMETEDVRATASIIYQNAKKLQEHIDYLWESINRLERGWEGGGKEDFVIDIFIWRNRVLDKTQELFSFETRIEKEVEEWEAADARLGEGRRPVDNSRVGKLFVQGSGDATTINPNDVYQGNTGDCYLMASLAALAAANPDLIRQMITLNLDGTYTVRFFNEQTGEAEYITVSADEIPKNKSGEPIYAKYGDNGELWPAIIEKGYAKWIDERNIRDPLWSRFLEKLGFEGKSDYKLISGGLPQVAMQQITGGDSTTFLPPTTFTEADLIKNLNQGNPITLGTLQSTDPAINGNSLYDLKTGQLVTGHAYYITGYDQVTGLVEVHNPWGWNYGQGTIKIPLQELEENIAMIAVNETP